MDDEDVDGFSGVGCSAASEDAEVADNNIDKGEGLVVERDADDRVDEEDVEAEHICAVTFCL